MTSSSPTKPSRMRASEPLLLLWGITYSRCAHGCATATGGGRGRRGERGWRERRGDSERDGVLTSPTTLSLPRAPSPSFLRGYKECERECDAVGSRGRRGDMDCRDASPLGLSAPSASSLPSHSASPCTTGEGHCHGPPSLPRSRRPIATLPSTPSPFSLSDWRCRWARLCLRPTDICLSLRERREREPRPALPAARGGGLGSWSRRSRSCSHSASL